VLLAMTKQERESFLADLHVGIISVAEDGRGPRWLRFSSCSKVPVASS